MNKVNYNYHMHTFRCGHASGMDEEYILKAIENGYKIVGFTDHIMLPNHNQPSIRGNIMLQNNYFESIKNLKKKYKGKIEILLGYEAEYYEEYEQYYRELLDSKKIDYLILGQHCYLKNDAFKWYFDNEFKINPELSLNKYVDDLIKAMKTGLFKYVCHPDVYMNSRNIWDELSINAARRICKAAKENNIPLEINLGASRWTKPVITNGELNHGYPFPLFWEIAKEEGCDVVIGIDAHSPLHYDVDPKLAYDIVERFGLNLLKDFKI